MVGSELQELGCSMLIDLHGRTLEATPGGQQPQTVIEAAKKAGLDGVAFVDRLQSSNASALIEAGKAGDMPVFVGVEIPAQNGRFLCFAPQVDPFFTREEWRQLMAVSGNPTVERIVSLFDGIGGAVLAAQPFSRENGVRLGDTLVFYDGLSGVEVLTGGQNPLEATLGIEIGVRLGLPLAAGSRVGNRLDDVGEVATVFSETITDQAELCQALRGGDFWAARLRGKPPRPPRRPSPGRHSGDRTSDRSSGNRPSSNRRRRGRPHGRDKG